MAELTSLERLQPSLLDRLTDDAPDEYAESRDRRVLSMRALRQAVLRDLSWLFNTTNLASAIVDFPHVGKSVVNFGMPDITGKSLSGLRLEDIERSLRQAIWDFEPRIIRHTLLVRAFADHSDRSRHNVIHFEIEADLWAIPYPERLYLKTELDLESGSVRIAEQNG